MDRTQISAAVTLIVSAVALGVVFAGIGYVLWFGIGGWF